MFANFDLLLDSAVIGHVSGFDTVIYRNDSLVLAVKFLPIGEHTLSFRYSGRDARATDSILWADYIQLTPTDRYVDSGVPILTDTVPAFSIYPNPAVNSITVTPSGNPIAIFDPLGRSYDVKQTGNSLDISTLPPGVYFVSDGVSRAKFVKE
jgi:hypothetical protein